MEETRSGGTEKSVREYSTGKSYVQHKIAAFKSYEKYIIPQEIGYEIALPLASLMTSAMRYIFRRDEEKAKTQNGRTRR
jgi:hypothetical protein